MQWIVKVQTEEDERKQRIRFVFDPLKEELRVTGECKINPTYWEIFSEANKTFVSTNEKYSITLDDLQELMSRVVIEMRPRIREYENLVKGFSVLKEVAFEEDEN